MHIHIRIGWLAAAVAAAGLGLGPPAAASNTIAEQEGLVCTVCHDKPGSKLLTDRGKFYETMRTLEGFDELTATFGSCTTCHVAKPGSERLTRTGRRLQLVFQDMQELRSWVMSEHPGSPEGSMQEDQEGMEGEGMDDGAPEDGAGEEGGDGGAFPTRQVLRWLAAEDPAP